MRTVLAVWVVLMTSSVASAQEWLCDPSWQFDEYCDCGCGIFDETCSSSTDANACEYVSNCAMAQLNPENNGECTQSYCAAPAGEPGTWWCHPAWLYDSYCDCGCGLPDPACESTTDVNVCEFCGGCNNDFGVCPGAIDPNNIAVCTACE